MVLSFVVPIYDSAYLLITFLFSSDLLRPLLRADPWKEGQDEVDASGHNLDHGGGGAGNLPKVITGTNTTFIMSTTTFIFVSLTDRFANEMNDKLAIII